MGKKIYKNLALLEVNKVKTLTVGFKLSLTAVVVLMAVNLRYTFIVLLIKAVNFLISS